MQKIYIYGKHAVTEALEQVPQIVRRVEIAPQMRDKNLLALIQTTGVSTAPLDFRKISSYVEGNASHQGVVALVSLNSLLLPFEKFMDTFNPTPDTVLLLLSELQDPHNVGTLIRSAAAFGASAVLMPTQKQSPITGAVVKASSGMAFRMPLVSLDNMQQAIATLKKKGVRVYGLTAKGTPIESEPFAAASLLVLGNEATGIAPAARVLCDQELSISMHPQCESLNVSAAGAVALATWSRKHPQALATRM